MPIFGFSMFRKPSDNTAQKKRYRKAFLETLEDRRLLAADFGDAPAPYPVTIAESGASHLAVGPLLGADRSSEEDGTPSAAADGDTHDDGIVFGNLELGQTASITVTVAGAPDGAKLDAWIDFDGTGDWNGPYDQIADSVEVINGENQLTFKVPPMAQLGDSFARFRLSTAGDTAPTGAADDGEVEDYKITIQPRQSVTVTSSSTNLVPFLWPATEGGNGHFYALVMPDSPAGNLNWEEARAAAESYEFMETTGHLLTVTSEEENEFIKNTFADQMIVSQGDTKGDFVWIGLSDAETESDYRWVTGEEFDYTNWAAPAPNVPNGEDYVHYHIKDYGFNNPFAWDDSELVPSNNDDRRVGFLVEFDAPFIHTDSTMSVNGDFIVAWDALANHDRDVWIQRYDINHNPLEKPLQVTTTGDQSRPAVSSSVSGDFVVGWDVGRLVMN